MREFGSIGEIMEADVEKLAQVPEITQAAAEEIYRYFHDQTINDQSIDDQTIFDQSSDADDQYTQDRPADAGKE